MTASHTGAAGNHQYLAREAIRLAGGQLQACPALDPRDRSEPWASPGAVVVSLDTYIEAAGIPDGGRAPLPLHDRPHRYAVL